MRSAESHKRLSPMIEEPEKVVKGLQVILTLFDSAKGYICIEDNKPDCIAKMKELVKDIDRIEVKEMMTKYPQGGERDLATGREINSSRLPMQADNLFLYKALHASVVPVPLRVLIEKKAERYRFYDGVDLHVLFCIENDAVSAGTDRLKPELQEVLPRKLEDRL